MATKKAKAEKKEPEKKAPVKPRVQKEERINIRCRSCFMVDGYTKKEVQCRHCGTKIYLIDMT